MYSCLIIMQSLSANPDRQQNMDTADLRPEDLKAGHVQHVREMK